MFFFRYYRIGLPQFVVDFDVIKKPINEDYLNVYQYAIFLTLLQYLHEPLYLKNLYAGVCNKNMSLTK